MLCGRFVPWPEVLFIVDIQPIGAGLKSAAFKLAFEHSKELIFAMKAPVRTVLRVLIALELMGLNNPAGNTLLLGEAARIVQLGTRQAGRIRNHSQHSHAKDPVRRVREICRIDPSGVSHDHAV
jgi:hypothetical protein